jgi:hypothetical protein
VGLIRNGAIEKQLRKHLDARGLRGSTARFDSLELAAIERPGWVQTFRFRLRVRRGDGDWTRFAGTCVDDERSSLFRVRMRELTDSDVQPSGDDATNHHARPDQQSGFGLAIYVAAALVITACGLLLRSMQ